MEQIGRGRPRPCGRTIDFRGYIHLKTIPDADPELIERAGRYADRISINVELPTDQRPEAARAGEVGGTDRQGAMGDHARGRSRTGETRSKKLQVWHPKFAPAGQSTQMIVGRRQCATDRRHRPVGLQTGSTTASTYAPGLLLCVQPDPGRLERGPPAAAPAPDARASALPVGLPDAASTASEPQEVAEAADPGRRACCRSTWTRSSPGP